MCLYPKRIRNKKYVANEKNGGIIPPVLDERVLYIDVGCSRCIECMKKKSRSWQVRLMEDLRVNKEALFVTYTFSDEAIDDLTEKKSIYVEDDTTYYNELCRHAIRYYLENWRKKYKRSLRHWFVTERGGRNSERVHVHGIVWIDSKEKEDSEKYKKIDRKDVIKLWKYGHVFVGSYVDGSTISYIVKYLMKQDEKHKEFIPKVFTSPGIGKYYVNRVDAKHNKFRGRETKEYYKFENGTKMAMPAYYKSKLYNEDERELLFRYALDKEVIYVMGEKIDISVDYNDYEEVLRHYRKINNRMGYGSDERNKEELKYKERLRIERLDKKI